MKGGGCDEWDNTMADVKIKGMGTHPEIIESALNPEDSPVTMHVCSAGRLVIVRKMGRCSVYIPALETANGCVYHESPVNGRSS